jgi:putative transposase
LLEVPGAEGSEALLRARRFAFCDLQLLSAFGPVGNRARNLFVKELLRVRLEYDFRLVKYVVMPNHVHLLMSEPQKGTVSTVLQMLKQRVARTIHKHNTTPREEQIAFAFECGGDKPRAFWQARFYDFNVYSKGKRKEKLNYMHANPMTRKLVKHPREWAWSSWANYMGESGLVEIDFA